MIRNYKFYDPESTKSRIVRYNFPAPFYENLDKYLKEIYGSNLYHVKEINHKDHIIRIHSAYDTGKGTHYVAPYKYGELKASILSFKKIINNTKEIFEPIDVSMYNSEEDLIMLLDTNQKMKAIALCHKLRRSDNWDLADTGRYVCNELDKRKQKIL